MDHSDGQAHADRTPTPAHRDMMYCHECRDEWFRDEHGLTCPECGSDFTEIIEEDHDPRDDEMPGHNEHAEDGDSIPSLEEAPPNPHDHPLAHHNPFRDHNDPEEGDISNLQWRQVGPGRFAVTGTIYRTISPNRGGGGNQNAGNPPIGPFASMLNSIIGGARPRSQPQGQDGQSSQGQPTPGTSLGSGPRVTLGESRFHYTSSARLYPRDADHPGPQLEPMDELNNVLIGLMAAFGEPPGQHNHDPQAPGNDPHVHFNPLLALLSQMMPGNAAAGDFVYSQEALDRIISQLMEQNATGNAPGPASQDDINSLPRKPVTVEMLGPEGRAECSICMEEVLIGEEVTELPCHHWFHHPCVAMWLSEHDTCPHCRHGITKTSENSANSSNDNSGGASEANASNPQMPGAFAGATGDGTPEHPFLLPDSPHHPAPNQDQGASSSHSGPVSGDESHSGGGFGERLRRGWFGPPR
ncbi:uncharacterized protein BDR25DRAFT_312764 [Lindgomyces ingoldianus]|uniref:Uncharacterized protein n=1 Tax=Lindgomyces ingoldianus TaxID=673940 RepID=A0ACB6R267_9PLEO|nr:uncharacterized protein BDR25DRAFT_312764 [Lindgomyces ingoldianus]KAF2472885.1 hypothetical protein BDR25DRAFT_312764 [Lindgomyces ingoldianus]